jgi:(1->4)-alpha-D-glucan 1-alpha-D-glucosylmutase
MQGVVEPPTASLTLRAREVVAATVEEIRGRRIAPGATYRLQLHGGFKFQQATEIAPYLAELGITDCYASPYLRAAPGSNHGYDITDPTRINPEIGTEADHEAWLEALKRHGLGLVLDVVPNHMGIMGNENAWWNDVLENGQVENGQASRYARYFDIDWSAPTRAQNRDRVLLPMLGDLFGAVLENGQLRIARDGGTFHVRYHEHRFPLDPKSYRRILEPALQSLVADRGADHPAARELQGLIYHIYDIPHHPHS